MGRIERRKGTTLFVSAACSRVDIGILEFASATAEIAMRLVKENSPRQTSSNRQGDDARRGGRLVRIRTLGGGVPAEPFIDAFRVPTVGVSLANYDDNQHTDNENLRLANLWSGIATLASIMTAK